MRPQRRRHRFDRLIVKVVHFLAPVLAVLLGFAAAQLPHHSSLPDGGDVRLTRTTFNVASVGAPSSATSASTATAVAVIVIVAALVVVAFWRVVMRLLIVGVIAVVAYSLIMLGMGISDLSRHSDDLQQTSAVRATSMSPPTPAAAARWI